MDKAFRYLYVRKACETREALGRPSGTPRNILIYYFKIQMDLLTLGPMKKMFLSITTAFLCLAASASAQTWSTVTPTYGGGYQFHEYSPYGNSWGTNDAHLRRWVPF
jgi:hypothetical protein